MSSQYPTICTIDGAGGRSPAAARAAFLCFFCTGAPFAGISAGGSALPRRCYQRHLPLILRAPFSITETNPARELLLSPVDAAPSSFLALGRPPRPMSWWRRWGANKGHRKKRDRRVRGCGESKTGVMMVVVAVRDVVVFPESQAERSSKCHAIKNSRRQKPDQKMEGERIKGRSDCQVVGDDGVQAHRLLATPRLQRDAAPGCLAPLGGGDWGEGLRTKETDGDAW